MSMDNMLGKAGKDSLLKSLTTENSKNLTGKDILSKSGGDMQVVVSKIASDVGVIAQHIQKL